MLTDSARSEAAPFPVTWIRAGQRVGAVAWREVWQARELAYFLVWRDAKLRYTQTVLGVGWALVQPFMAMVIFTIFFGGLGHIPSDGVPYPIFSFAALVPWTYFAGAVSGGANSMVGNQYLISKVYFPRVLVPIAAVLTPALDMAIAFVFLIFLMIWYRIQPTPAMLLIPVWTALAIASASGAAIWLAALNVRYRDVRHVLPYFIQIWIFATPVAYPASLVPPEWRLVYALNPMASVVEGFRHALFGTPGPGAMALVSTAVVCIALVTGTSYFRRVESSLVDLA
jgi:homopolymeric O-antigen transport system permease protein